MSGLVLLAALNMNSPETPAHSPATGLAGTSDSAITKVAFDPTAWTLIWSDEFDADGPPDPANWGHESGYLRNREVQYYTDDPRNVRVEGGRLVIEAHLDESYERGYSSASLRTKGRREFLLGRIEARAKVPSGVGTWPAIWTLGTDIGEVGWPQCGELDILEHVGFDPMVVHANVHTGDFNHLKKNGRGSRITAPEKPWESFNLYAVEWYEDRVEFFFNESRYLVVYRQPGDGAGAWPFDQPQYLIINLAIGGDWGGLKGIDDAAFPHRFEIDYVRYYQRVAAGGAAE